jgi:calcyclin binding protein
MVAIDELDSNIPAWEERLLDAESIEQAAATITRPTARMHLESLSKKLRKESDALKRLEESKSKAEEGIGISSQLENTVLDKPIVEDITEAEPTPALKTPSLAPDRVVSPTNNPPVPISSAKYIPITTFAFDSGKYDSPTVTIYVSLDGVKEIPKENISCEFTKQSLDLIVRDLKGKSYRLFKDNLAHDIDPKSSKFLVKSDRLVIKLGKTKGKYGYESWSDLVAKKPKRDEKKNDPHASIMDMMKDMYESGDDNMRKIIGETMEKQRRGELGKNGPSMDDI